MNLLALFNDAAAIVRLRYRPAEEYRYGAPVVAAVLLALGVIHSAAVAPLIGSGYGTVALSVLMIGVRWLALSQCISAVLHYFGAPRLPLRGYILASEALALPTLLVLYLPELAPLSLLWGLWTFWAQAIGLMRLGGQRGSRVLLGYLAGLLVMGIAYLMLFGIFAAAGWIDMEQALRNMQQAPPGKLTYRKQALICFQAAWKGSLKKFILPEWRYIMTAVFIFEQKGRSPWRSRASNAQTRLPPAASFTFTSY